MLTLATGNIERKLVILKAVRAQLESYRGPYRFYLCSRIRQEGNDGGIHASELITYITQELDAPGLPISPDSRSVELYLNRLGLIDGSLGHMASSSRIGNLARGAWLDKMIMELECAS